MKIREGLQAGKQGRANPVIKVLSPPRLLNDGIKGTRGLGQGTNSFNQQKTKINGMISTRFSLLSGNM